MIYRIYKRVVIPTILLGIGLAALLIFIIPHAPEARALDTGVNIVEASIDLTGTDIRVIIARIIRVALGLLGVIAVLIVLWGGFQWMTSGGEADKIEQAKRILVNGAIGLAIILTAFAITQFILNSLIAATTGVGLRGQGQTGIVRNSGSLGRGIIEMHYPERGAVDIARNTNIVITFKQPIQLSSIINGYDDADTPDNLADDTVTTNLNTNTVKIYTAASGEDGALASDAVMVRFTPDRRTFVFDPVALLGSPSENVLYNVKLPGDGLRLENGQAAFTGSYSGGYEWQFETGTFVDLTPPVVTDYFPYPATRSVPPHPTSTYERNVLIQVNFNEAIDPTSVTNPGSIVVSAGGSAVSGSWGIANGYQSIEFVTTDACGTNSCGETIYCLPANADVSVRVRAADLTDDTLDGAASDLPYNGVADVAANSLNDRGNNAVAEGSPTDDVNFPFGTSGVIDISPPIISEITPDSLEGDVAPDAIVDIAFSEIMSRLSINTDSIQLLPDPDHELWYQLRSANRYAVSDPVPDDAPVIGTRALIHHGLLLQSFINTEGETDNQGYVSAVLPGVRDAYQNCFVPSGGPDPSEESFCTPNPYCCNGVPSTESRCGIPGQPGVNILP